jgi:hypothetical protein
MTFKTASDLQSYQQRVGSHATKEHPTGRIDAVPEWAQEPEEYYNTIKQQYLLMQETVYHLAEEQRWCSLQLRNDLPFEEFKRLSNQLQNLGKLQKEMQDNLSELKPIMAEANNRSWATAFWLLAKREIDEIIFNKIEDMVRDLVGRDRLEVRALKRSELPPEFLKKQNRARHLRQKLRDKNLGVVSKKRRAERERQQQRKNNS